MTITGIEDRVSSVATRWGMALRISEAASQVDDLSRVVDVCETAAAGGECIVEVKAAGVNISDVKAALGHMAHAVWPRTPGRDFAGVVVEGSPGLVGKEVWGSGGKLGITKDGTFARFLALQPSELSEKPSNISLDEAGAIGVPFVTAFEGLRRAGGVKASDVVLVLGGGGWIGQAVIQLVTMSGARVIAAGRDREICVDQATRPFETIDASTRDIAEYVKEATGGRGADIVFNTVGGTYFEQGCASMAPEARQIFVAAIGGGVSLPILEFLRGRHTFLGVDSLGLTGEEGAEILDLLRPGFESGKLKPFPVHEQAVFSLESAVPAFKAVWEGAPDRIVIRP